MYFGFSAKGVEAKGGYFQKQGLVQDYSQRLIEGNIYRQKLSRLKLSRLRPNRLRFSRLRPLGLRLSRLQLYGSETGGGGRGGGSNEIIYSSISRKKISGGSLSLLQL